MHISIYWTTITLPMKNFISNVLQTLSNTVNYCSWRKNVNPIWRENQIEALWYSHISKHCGLLNMEAIRSSETPMLNYQTTQCHNQEPKNTKSTYTAVITRNLVLPRNCSTLQDMCAWTAWLLSRTVNQILKHFPIPRILNEKSISWRSNLLETPW
jgi:hypothetical protein